MMMRDREYPKTHDWGRTVVVWSGGADSTCLLNHYAGVSSEDWPIVALSVVAYPHISRPLLQKQAEVQKRYLEWAKRRGYHIKHHTMRVTGSFGYGREGNAPQPSLWLAALSQILDERDRVMMGYIRTDDVWHCMSEFRDVFDAFCKLKEFKHAKLEFPFEWEHKVDILRRLKKGKVPDRCWFSCDHTKDGKPCGQCSKCDELAAARALLKKQDVARKVIMLDDKPKKKRKR